MNIFEIYETIDQEHIDNYIITKQEENLFLDFKTTTTADFTNKDDKKTFARALSGFANASGGLIIWGIDARKNAEGIDCANKKIEIDKPSLFISRLNQLTGELVDPVVDGVMHKKIPVSDERGFAVTLIPPSDAGPHMAKGGEDRYYKRSGDSFYKMEHFDIEDMFGRRKKPKLNLHKRVELSSTSSSEGGFICSLLILLGIENIGRAPAKSPFFAVNIKSRHKIHRHGIDGNGHFGLQRLTGSLRSAEEKYGASADKVIHAGTLLDVTAIGINVNLSNTPTVEDVILDYKIAAEDIRLVEGESTITSQELIAEATRHWHKENLEKSKI
jgi:hypothetical protein